jgi:dolichol kinase
MNAPPPLRLRTHQRIADNPPSGYYRLKMFTADFSGGRKRRYSGTELGFELLRKCIHMLIALVPFLAALDRSNTALLLMAGVLFYFCAESLRFLGFSLPLISSVTRTVSRKREQGHFTLAPVTLGLGALLTIIIFPPPAAAAAIYALAFGDSVSTITGKFLGRLRPAFLSGKSVEGSLACFTVSALAAYLVFFDPKTALAVGLASVLIDALPIREFDNILLPLAAGFAALVF